MPAPAAERRHGRLVYEPMARRTVEGQAWTAVSSRATGKNRRRFIVGSGLTTILGARLEQWCYLYTKSMEEGAVDGD